MDHLFIILIASFGLGCALKLGCNHLKKYGKVQLETGKVSVIREFYYILRRAISKKFSNDAVTPWNVRELCMDMLPFENWSSHFPPNTYFFWSEKERHSWESGFQEFNKFKSLSELRAIIKEQLEDAVKLDRQSGSGEAFYSAEGLLRICVRRHEDQIQIQKNLAEQAAIKHVPLTLRYAKQLCFSFFPHRNACVGRSSLEMEKRWIHEFPKIFNKVNTVQKLQKILRDHTDSVKRTDEIMGDGRPVHNHLGMLFMCITAFENKHNSYLPFDFDCSTDLDVSHLKRIAVEIFPLRETSMDEEGWDILLSEVFGHVQNSQQFRKILADFVPKVLADEKSHHKGGDFYNHLGLIRCVLNFYNQAKVRGELKK